MYILGSSIYMNIDRMMRSCDEITKYCLILFFEAINNNCDSVWSLPLLA